MAWVPETERLFFALWPDAVVRQAIYEGTRRAVRASGGKPVPPENFHITLVFLGNLDAAAAAAAREAAAGVRGKVFSLALDRFGFWPGSRLAWFGPSEVPEAGRMLAAMLMTALRVRGLTPDAQSFFPHVTLARKVSKPGVFGCAPMVPWPLEEFVLARSITRPSGSEYRVLASWPLAAGQREL